MESDPLYHVEQLIRPPKRDARLRSQSESGVTYRTRYYLKQTIQPTWFTQLLILQAVEQEYAQL